MEEADRDIKGYECMLVHRQVNCTKKKKKKPGPQRGESSAQGRMETCQCDGMCSQMRLLVLIQLWEEKFSQTDSSYCLYETGKYSLKEKEARAIDATKHLIPKLQWKKGLMKS